MLQLAPRFGQLGGGDGEVGRAGDQIGLVGFQKAQDRGEHGRIAETVTQIPGREPGEGEQPVGAGAVGQRPGQSRQRQRRRVALVCFRYLHRLRCRELLGRGVRCVGQKILVVEDNELNLKLFCDLLRAHGYEAEPVRDGREAVERARAFRPELVIMDIQMPYVSGLELIEQLKADAELKATPIMAVTAYAAKGDEQRIRDAGAEGYVSKPISLMRFIEAVRGLLAAGEEDGPAEADDDRPEAPSETVIPAEAGISGREDSDVDGERPAGAPPPFTP